MEGLGVAQIIDEFLKFGPFLVLIELDLNRIPGMTGNVTIELREKAFLICDIEDELSQTATYSAVGLKAEALSLNLPESSFKAQHSFVLLAAGHPVAI